VILDPPRRALVTGAHPDDPELGAGGTMARLVALGTDVTCWLACVPDRVDDRRLEASDGAKRLGVHMQIASVGIGRHVSEIAPHVLVGAVDDLLLALEPEVIFTHWPDDPHQDHRLVASAVMASARRTAADFYFYGPTDLRAPTANAFAPTTFVDISSVMDAKTAAVSAHASQIERKSMSGWQDRMHRQAAWYGTIAGVDLAEGFTVLRQLLA